MLQNPEAFNLWIDRPKEGQNTNPYLFHITGWLTSEPGKPVNSIFLGNDNNPKKIALNQVDRPDVIQAFPGKEVLGFHHLLSIELLDLPIDYSLTFELEGAWVKVPVDLPLDKDLYQEFWDRKREKLERIRPFLCHPMTKEESIEIKEGRVLFSDKDKGFTVSDARYSFLNADLKELGKVKHTDSVSSNSYDTYTDHIIQEKRDGLILDVGAGLRRQYLPNVVNFEIANYPTTDVLGIGECLPFKDNTFDGIFSLAVLEHVRDPFSCAKEMLRVLKPGGKLYVVVPFLQPFHGYPDHYYNMTSAGLRNLFGDSIEIIEKGVPRSGLPIWTLNWFLRSYVQGLPVEVAEKFKDMKVGDLMGDSLSYLDEEYVTKLPESVNDELACVNFIFAEKK